MTQGAQLCLKAPENVHPSAPYISLGAIPALGAVLVLEMQIT